MRDDLEDAATVASGSAEYDGAHKASGTDGRFSAADRHVLRIRAATCGSGDVLGGGDIDTIDVSDAGPTVVTHDAENPANGTVMFLDAEGRAGRTVAFHNIGNVIGAGPICFTPGTLIATPKGERPVETLRSGDKIITRDNGIQQIRWYGEKHLAWATLCANPHMKPVRIRKGSLGNGLPEEDMLVSPNHRILVASDRTALYFEETEVLVAAKHLVGVEGIHGVDSAGTTYIHFMFDRHEVVLANGAWTESFQPTDRSLKGLGNAQRNEIFEIFPELRGPAGLSGYAAARKTVKKDEAGLLLPR